MNFTFFEDLARECIAVARQASADYMAYVGGVEHIKRSVDDFTDMHIEKWEALGRTIKVIEVPMPPYGITQSAYVAYIDKYEILIRSGHPIEWNRYFQCKEIFHVVVDRENARNMQMFEHVEAVLSPNLGNFKSPAAVWDHLANAMAMEFLFPYADRVKILAEDPSPDPQIIADQYGVPVACIEGYLSNATMSFFKSILGE